MQYRPEIDGLRALAVLPVILFHAHAPGFAGGFVGVDVFFVISGYLITSLILSDLAAGKFSILHFYERRARRILPALFVVIAASYPFAYAWMEPQALAAFASSVRAVLVFLANFYFADAQGYFSQDAELYPLLHTWSLAVEEQFYLLFPLLLMAIWKRPSLAFWLSVLLIASLALAEWGWRNEPDDAFFFPLARFWELFAGALCAVWLRRGVPPGPASLGGLGLALILLPALLYTAETPSPSLWIGIPVLGTVLVILYARTDTPAGRVLAHKSLVGVGLLSYSAYLWHQPILAFARIRLEDQATIMAPAILWTWVLVLSLALAWVTWRFVETPFRRKAASKIMVFGLALIVGATLFVPSQFLHNRMGIPGLTAELRTQLKGWQAGRAHADGWACMSAALERPLPAPACQMHGTDQPDVVLLGDSNAASVIGALTEVTGTKGLSLVAAVSAGCPPVPGLVQIDGGARNCPAFNDATAEWVQGSTAKVVVLIAQWPLYETGQRFRAPDGTLEFGVTLPYDVEGAPQGGPDEARADRMRTATLDWIDTLAQGGKQVIVVDAPPLHGWDPALRATERLAAGLTADDDGSARAPHDAYAERILAAFAGIDKPDVTHIKTADLFCTEDGGTFCPSFADGAPLFSDVSHVSTTGAGRIADAIAAHLPQP